MSYNLLWMMNWAMWSTFTLIDFRCPEETRISEEPPEVPFDTLGQKSACPPVTKMSFLQIKKKPKQANNKECFFLQFSAVS